MQNAFSIRIVFAVLALIGFALVPRLPLTLLPQPRDVQLRVDYSWSQAPPALIEQEVTAPLEGAFGLLRGIDRIYSVSNNGSGYIDIELKENTDPELLRFELSAAIRRLYPDLPAGVSYPILRVSGGDQDQEKRPVLTYSLTGPLDAAGLYTYATEQLLPTLSLSSGLRRTDLVGGNQREWVITLDEAQLQALDLDRAAVRNALQQHFRQAAIGTVRQDDSAYYLRLTAGQVSWSEIPIRRQEQRILRLGDLATAELREMPPARFYRINGQNTLRLLCYPEARANTLTLADDLRARFGELEANLPSGYQLQLEEDTTRFLRIELEKIQRRTLLSLGMLLLFAAITYRSWRYLLLIVLSLLANLGLAAIGYYYFDVQLQLYALAGITVSFGMLIDNTIIMAHHLRTQGDRRVFSALLAATLTTLSALLVLFFLPEDWQYKLADFGRVLMINLSASLLVAYWLIPALLDWLFPGQVKPKSSIRGLRQKVKLQWGYQRYLRAALRYRPLLVTVVVLGFGLPVFLLPAKIEDWSRYNQTIGSDVYQEDIRPYVDKFLGGSLRLFYRYVYEKSNYRQPEETVLYVRGSMDEGATAQQLDRAMRLIEAYLQPFDKELRQFVTRVSSGQRGSLAIYFNKDYEFTFPYILKARLQGYVSDIGNVDWSVFGVGRGFSTGGGGRPPSYRVSMYGFNKDQLLALAERFAERLKTNPRVRKVDTEGSMSWFQRDRYVFDFELDRQLLARYDLPPFSSNILLQRFNQAIRPDLYTPDRIPVRLLGDQQTSRDRYQFNSRQFDVPGRKVMDLKALGTIEKRQARSAIHKENQQYIRVVQFEYTGSPRFGSRHLNRCMEGMRPELPLGYSMERRRGNILFREEAKRTYGLVIPMIAVIFFICAIVFESLRQAIAIVLLIPVSFIGIFLAFYWVPGSFDQGGYTAFLLVSGLVVNSLILIVNDYNRLRREQPLRPSLSLYLRALGQKLVPVILSVLSTVFGLIPFLLDGRDETFWFALALGAIGGLLFSVLVLLFFVPIALFSVKTKG